MIFCAWNYRNGPIFRLRSQCDVKTPPDFVFEAVVYKQRNAVQHISASTRTEPDFPKKLIFLTKAFENLFIKQSLI